MSILLSNRNAGISFFPEEKKDISVQQVSKDQSYSTRPSQSPVSPTLLRSQSFHIRFPQKVHCFCPAWCLQLEDMYFRQAVIILKILYLP